MAPSLFAAAILKGESIKIFNHGKMRRDFQTRFGNAGRGLIFPYRVAKTNEPTSYRSESSVKWESRRNVILNSTIPNGISGITIKTYDTLADLSFTLQNQQNLNYEFNRLTILHDKGSETFDLKLSDDSGKVIARIDSSINPLSVFESIVSLDTAISKFRMNVLNKDTMIKRQLSLYGLVAENGKEGILYHMIGVNGAEFRHYNSSKYFLEQLASLKPDLLIISLGTNDAYPISFNEENFRNQADTLLTSIKKYYPELCIILSAPGDSFRKRKHKNKNMAIAGNVLKCYAVENNMAFWDWYGIMGGLGSCLKWQKKNLCQPDRLHLTRAGYEIQGDLLYEAIMKSYRTFKKE